MDGLDVPRFSIDIDATSPTPRISVYGSCTGKTLDDLASALDAACSSHPRRIVIDLNTVGFIDGAAMARILQFRDRIEGTVVTVDVREISSVRLMRLMDAASAA